MGRELDRTLECLRSGLDEAETRIVLREDLRLSKKSADYYLAAAGEVLAALKAPKSVVRNRRNEVVAQAVAEEGALRTGQRAVLADRAVAQRAALDASFLREFEAVAGRILAKKVVVKPSAIHRKKGEIKRAVNIAISDTHFGSDLDPKEVPLEYRAPQEARRFAWVMQQVADYKPQYRDHSSLNFHLLGDTFQNHLHDPRDGRALAEQAAAATYYLVQGISYQAANWRQVDVYCAVGNHGRFTSRHPGRGIDQKWDSLENVVYFGAKLALAHISNVRFHLVKTPFYTWESFGEHGYATHGDTVLNIGSPAHEIKTGALTAQIHKINAGREQASNPRCKLFIAGHAHFSVRVQLATGEVLIINGPLVPPDPYSISHGQFGITSSQTVWESIPGFIGGDFRGIEVGPKQDQDASLEGVIKPFEDFIS